MWLWQHQLSTDNSYLGKDNWKNSDSACNVSVQYLTFCISKLTPFRLLLCRCRSSSLRILLLIWLNRTEITSRMDIISKLSVPNVPVIFIVKDNIEQHQHDHRHVPKHWMTVLEYLQMETKSLIVRDWHELNHAAKKTRIKFTQIHYSNILPESHRSQNLITRIPLLNILISHDKLYLLLRWGKVDDTNVGEHWGFVKILLKEIKHFLNRQGIK